jgi:hypothetical protein
MTDRGRPDANAPYPDLRGAFVLTLLALVAAAFTSVAFLDFGVLAAIGVGQAIGVGAIASLGAQRVPEPQARRLGLRALDWASVPTILCLTPAVVLVSEVDNFAAEWAGEPAEHVEAPSAIDSDPAIALDDAVDRRAGDEATHDGASEGAAGSGSPGAGREGGASHEGSANGEGGTDAEGSAEDDAARAFEAPIFDPHDPWSLLSAIVVMVGISPVVEEFLFRGVIQQGLVQRMGLLRGVTMVALLWTLLRPAPFSSFARFLVAAAASFGLGCALGFVRIATGSILGSILLASSWAAVGLAAVSLEGRVDLPGLNVEGSHVPITVTIACVVIVGWAGQQIFREAERRFEAEPPPPVPNAD